MHTVKQVGRSIARGTALTIAIAGMFTAAARAEQTISRDWSYSGVQFPGPAAWGDVRPDYGTCKTGKLQSPVNIASGAAEKATLPPIEFQYSPSVLKLVNTGYTTQVNPDKGSQIVVGGEPYTLVQYHFHAPAEEQIDGKTYPMGAHLVHLSASGKIAVVAVLFETGIYNPALASLWARFPRVVGSEIPFPNARMDAAKLLPSDRAYYVYEGSLNMPPCSEGVTWFVLKEPVQVSAGQIRAFTAQHGSNARPVQPLNNRQVRVSQ
jgi:carbonic anhydrase